MIINTDVYRCPKCGKNHYFDTSKPYDKTQFCTKCITTLLEFRFNADRDTEKAEQMKTAPKYHPSSDPNSPYYTGKKIITCPYCKSTNTSKIGVVGRSVSFGLFGFGSSKVGKQWHCSSCKSDF